MRMFDFEIAENAAEQLKRLVNGDPVEKKKYEEKVKIKLLQEDQSINPDDFDLTISFNQISNNIELKLLRK